MIPDMAGLRDREEHILFRFTCRELSLEEAKNLLITTYMAMEYTPKGSELLAKKKLEKIIKQSASSSRERESGCSN